MREQVDFLTEPNILKDLGHPSIPRIVDIFYKDDSLYMVEDYIEGETLEKLIERKGGISSEEAVSIALKLCEVLGYLHSFNPPIIYRDLKPSNVIKQNKDVILIDFGISRLYKENEAHDTIYMGSKGYAAPEQYGSEQSDIQTDIYGLGAIIYFMVNGRAPLNLMEALKDESYEKRVESDLREIIKKAMEIEKSKRYLNIKNIKEKLEDFLYKHQDKTVILKQNTKREDEKTKILSRKAKTRDLPKKGKKYKNIFVITTCLAILLICISIINKSSRNSKPIGKDNIKYETDITKADDKQDNAKNNTKAENIPEDKDNIIQGILYKNSPIVSEKSSDEEDKENKANGKAKGKYKKKDKDKDEDDEDNYTNNLVYKLSPAASTSKYYNKFTCRIEYVQFMEDKLVVYYY
ncbi:protein kinase [Clostridium bovifaecis]|uniref:Protein kinase n=1 Tax=Clostridium bovifaecis TaxID=2184719 RepID=A0A6I6EVF8_9CLOT|nr:protein kinase [Clostridium bovifaecis]